MFEFIHRVQRKLIIMTTQQMLLHATKKTEPKKTEPLQLDCYFSFCDDINPSVNFLETWKRPAKQYLTLLFLSIGMFIYK